MRMGNREGGGPGRGKSEKRKVRGKEKPGKRKVRGKEKPGKVGEGKETAEREIWVGGSRREERGESCKHLYEYEPTSLCLREDAPPYLDTQTSRSGRR